jgi:hypothetical protein
LNKFFDGFTAAEKRAIEARDVEALFRYASKHEKLAAKYREEAEKLMALAKNLKRRGLEDV